MKAALFALRLNELLGGVAISRRIEPSHSSASYYTQAAELAVAALQLCYWTAVRLATVTCTAAFK
jgi:hypothetical protein